MIWLIGHKGMLGSELARLFDQKNLEWRGSDREVSITTGKDSLFAFGRTLGPVAFIVNCAAYTAVDKAEDDAEACKRLNTLGAANVADTATALGAVLIQLSTDYVFDGKGIKEGNGVARPYREDDSTGPAGVYGLTKRDGETEVLARCKDSYIIRTAWLYGEHGNNFVATMLRLMNERKTVSVVDDQKGTPTNAGDLAAAIAALIEQRNAGKNIPCGIYHYTNEGAISWYDFARAIYAGGRGTGLLAGECFIKPCTTDAYPTRARRPAYSVLDKSKIKAALGIAIPRWDESLASYLQKLK
ncbi:MAG: dTDP-4-dehydrorhamnose reductase [Treponema sp.]|jgi:dTDP-4-dehydrorhamnose reductase|nr:dTDP-4-dehydrorhamnose reductase [Treponema sp.]